MKKFRWVLVGTFLFLVLIAVPAWAQERGDVFFCENWRTQILAWDQPALQMPADNQARDGGYMYTVSACSKKGGTIIVVNGNDTQVYTMTAGERLYLPFAVYFGDTLTVYNHRLNGKQVRTRSVTAPLP